jgi:hypothetical protein
MAGVLPTNLLSTYDIGGFGYAQNVSSQLNHEDLTDVLTILDSVQTPGFSGAPKIRAKDRVHSWPVQALSAPVSAGAAVGSDFGGDTLTVPVRLLNGTQIFRLDVVVDDGERASNPAGISDMYDHQVMLQFKNLARNFEYVMFRNNTTGSATGLESSAVSNAPLMAGIRGFGITSGLSSAGSVSAQLVTQATVMFNNGAEPDTIWFAPSRKIGFVQESLGTAINVRNIAASDQRLIANIDVFESPLGQVLAIVADRFIPMGTASASGYADFIGDRSMAKVAFFRPPAHIEMGKNGDHTRGIVRFEATLELTHPSAWGMVSNVTGASSLTT